MTNDIETNDRSNDVDNTPSVGKEIAVTAAGSVIAIGAFVALGMIARKLEERKAKKDAQTETE